VSDADPFDPFELDDLYDERTLARFDPHAPRRVPAEVARGWRNGLGAGAIVTTAMLGVRDASEPERRDPVIEEIDLDRFVDPDAPVVYHHVAGAPKASVAVVRPWLL
jgi:hypothetical protein